MGRGEMQPLIPLSASYFYHDLDHLDTCGYFRT